MVAAAGFEPATTALSTLRVCQLRHTAKDVWSGCEELNLVDLLPGQACCRNTSPRQVEPPPGIEPGSTVYETAALPVKLRGRTAAVSPTRHDGHGPRLLPTPDNCWHLGQDSNPHTTVNSRLRYRLRHLGNWSLWEVSILRYCLTRAVLRPLTEA